MIIILGKNPLMIRSKLNVEQGDYSLAQALQGHGRDSFGITPSHKHCRAMVVIPSELNIQQTYLDFVSASTVLLA